MKKLAIALIVAASLSGPALAADLSPRVYAKAPVAPGPSWSGLWVSGGFGYGLMDYQHLETSPGNGGFPAGTAFGFTEDTSGRGFLGKIGLGYDHQFSSNIVIGTFADFDWSNIKGNGTNSALGEPLVGAFAMTGQYKNDYSWAVGARAGYVVLPTLLTYINGGYTQAHFKQVNYLDGFFPDPTFGSSDGVSLAAQNRGGWFIGTGTEYALPFGNLPGLFWKNEVRFSEFGSKTASTVCGGPIAVCLVGATITNQTSRVYEQKATTELVYRFNWAGPSVTKY